MKRSFVNRRDILCCLAAGIPPEAVADLCGFGLERSEVRPTMRLRWPQLVRSTAPPVPEPVSESALPSFSSLVAVHSGVREEGFEPSPSDVGTLAVPCSEEELRVRFGSPPLEPLMPLSRLWPYLRSVLGHRRPGRRLDVARVTRMAARGDPLLRLPRHAVHRWTPHARLIIDRSLPVGFVDEDIRIVVGELARLRGRSGLDIEPVEAGQIATLPAKPVPTLILGDLGQLRGAPSLIDAWRGFGQRLRREGVSPVALVPCPRDRWRPRLASLWRCVCWDRHARILPSSQGLEPLVAPRAGEEAACRMNRVLDLLSPALLVEPALLRAVRCSLPEGQADVGSEFDVRTSPFVEVAGSDLTLASQERPTRAERFAGTASRSLKQKVTELILTHHAGCSPWLRWREVLNLCEAGAPVSPGGRQEAAEGQERLNVTMLRDLDRPAVAERFGLFAARCWEMAHLSPKARGDKQAAHAWALTCRFYGWKESEIPEGMSPEDIQEAMRMALPDPGRVTQWQVRSVPRAKGGRMLQINPWTGAASEAGRAPRSGFPLAVLFTRRGHLTAVLGRTGLSSRYSFLLTPGRTYELSLPPCDTVLLEGDCGHVEIREVPRPPWATRFGWDAFGLFADFEVDGVVFPLRWIPPGTFLMGSPEDEAGRYDDEGPQHRVTVGRGFWLGATPVTQGQYAVVTGKRPSYFKNAGDLAPVEQVNWEDCRKFCRALAGKVTDLDSDLAFRLPSEAEWEYACRAGTDTALYTGPLTIRGERDGPELDDIAWYGGNSGVDYQGGYDSSDWPEKQYDHKSAGTHSVAQKKANPWGLYDMLGNVWEWCEDTWHAGYEDAPSDGSAWVGKKGERRVCRGGSWIGFARDCRCAYRGRDWGPGNRIINLGFRLVLAPRSTEASKLVERSAAARAGSKHGVRARRSRDGTRPGGGTERGMEKD